MGKYAKTPVLRFAGFTDDWEQRKLGEMVQFSKGTGYSKADLKDSGTPIILYGRLYTKYETVIDDVDTFADEKAGAVYSRGGEVIVPASGETAEDISIASVVEKSGILLGGDLNIITPLSNLDPAFLAISISNGKPHEDMAKMAQGKSVVHLHNTDLAKINLMYPNCAEQKQIRNYFKCLDDLITLHQRKYDKLMSIKKSMLEKMFPRDGATVPEIRFPGFTGAWEQRKLETAFDFSVSNNTLSRADLNYKDGEVKSVHYGDVLIKYGSVLDAQIDEIPFITGKKGMDFSGQWLQEGDIIIADTAEDETTGKATEIRHLGAIPVVSGLHTIVCRPTEKMAPYYLGYYLNSDSYHSQLLPLMQGIKVLSLSRSNLIKTEIKYPKSQEEQKQIGCFFRSLDNLIALHQRKLEMLKNFKKSCLERMFV